MNKSFSVKPNINDQSLIKNVKGKDHLGEDYSQNVVMERPLTIFLNKQEVVTSMTVGDHPEWMAVGFLVNQGMLSKNDKIVSIDLDWESEAIVVRTDKQTNYEHKIKRKIRTSGCAVGTMFGDVMDLFNSVKLNKNSSFRTSWLKTLLKDINTQPSLYLEAGAIHSCILCKENKPLVFIEDVGRHNALDKIAGWLWFNKIDTSNLLLYTTGRLTSEMVIKTVQMHIPILISRSGFTAAGVELALKSNLTLIGRAKGTRFIVLSGLERIIYD